MSTPADQLDAQLAPPPVPKTPVAAPPATPASAPQDLSNAYMAHSDTMRGAAAAEQLDAMVKGQQKPDEAPEPPAAPEEPKKSLGEKATAVGKDIGLGVVETIGGRAVVKGVRDAYQSMIHLAGEAVDFAKTELPEAPVDVTARSEERKAAVGNEPTNVGELPDINAPKTVTGTIVKNIVQFVTGLRVAGGQLKALGVPTAETMAGGRALTALKGFVGQFEAFDGSQQNLSNLVQSVPALQNPVSKFLATDPTDSDAVNRLKSSVEGTVGGQLVDAFVGGLRFLRSANKVKAEAEQAAGLAEGNTDLGTDIGPPSKAMTELGDFAAKDDAPLVSARFNNAQTKIGDQEFAAERITPQQVVKMGEPADGIDGPSQTVKEVDRWTVGERPIWEMSPDELGAHADALDAHSLNELTQAFGGDKTAAQKFQRLAMSERDSAYEAAEKMKDALPTEQQALIDKWEIGGGPYSLNGSDVRDLERATRDMHLADSPQELVDRLKYSLTKIGDAKDPSSMNPQQMQALMETRAAHERANEMGWNLKEIGEAAIRQSAARFSDPEDAAFMLRRFLKDDFGTNARIAPPKVPEPAPQSDVAGPTSPGATEAQAKEPGIYVNFARIDGPDDIKRAMSEMVGAFKNNIEDARRGVQTFEDTKLGAGAVDAWDTLMSRRVGEPLNAEQSLAARQLWATSASKTYDLASIAVKDPSPENLFAFRKMMATHAAIQEQVIAARTETARALSSWRIPAGAQDQRMAEMLGALKQDTGRVEDGLSISLNMAQRVQALQEAMDVGGLNNFSEKGVYATTRDALLEAWTNGLLTSPLTHVKVFVSNAATTALRIGERAIAGKVNALLGDTDGVAVGEAGAQYSGLVSGLKDAFRYAGKSANAFLHQEPLPPLGDDPLSNAIKAAKTGVYSTGEQTPEHSFGGAISSQAFNLSESGWVGQGVDLLGQLVRSPGRALTAEHDFFRSVGYRMEVNALATRQATAEVTAGKITQDALGGRIAEIVANPPPSVTIGSIDAMKYQTFTDAPGKLANLIEQARNDFPLLRVIIPFYRIPSRILSYTFERTPLAPLMSAYQANIAAGGARASLARAQMGLGTSLMLATADVVLSGQLTGSGPPEKSQRSAMMNTGWLPYSMKVGDRWVQYNKLETMGSSMAMAADVVETLHGYNTAVNADDPDMGKLAVATVLSIAQDITSKTYLEGLSRMFETIANPKTEGEAQIRSMAGSIVPAGIAAVDRVQDPYQRSVYSMMDAIKARTPGLSETLPPRRDVWGDPIQHASGMGTAYDLLSPFATRQPVDSPIDREIVRLGANVNLPNAKISFGQGASVDLHKDPALYSRYIELAGNGYKDPAWGMGAKDLLNSIVSGNHPLSPIYNMKSDGPDGQKAEMIHGIMNQYREGAKQQLLEENPKLQPIIDQKRASAQALKMPVLQ